MLSVHSTGRLSSSDALVTDETNLMASQGGIAAVTIDSTNDTNTSIKKYMWYDRMSGCCVIPKQPWKRVLMAIFIPLILVIMAMGVYILILYLNLRHLADATLALQNVTVQQLCDVRDIRIGVQATLLHHTRMQGTLRDIEVQVKTPNLKQDEDTAHAAYEIVDAPRKETLMVLSAVPQDIVFSPYTPVAIDIPSMHIHVAPRQAQPLLRAMAMYQTNAQDSAKLPEGLDAIEVTASFSLETSMLLIPLSLPLTLTQTLMPSSFTKDPTKTAPEADSLPWVWLNEVAFGRPWDPVEVGHDLVAQFRVLLGNVLPPSLSFPTLARPPSDAFSLTVHHQDDQGSEPVPLLDVAFLGGLTAQGPVTALEVGARLPSASVPHVRRLLADARSTDSTSSLRLIPTLPAPAHAHCPLMHQLLGRQGVPVQAPMGTLMHRIRTGYTEPRTASRLPNDEPAYRVALQRVSRGAAAWRSSATRLTLDVSFPLAPRMPAPPAGQAPLRLVGQLPAVHLLALLSDDEAMTDPMARLSLHPHAIGEDAVLHLQVHVDVPDASLGRLESPLTDMTLTGDDAYGDTLSTLLSCLSYPIAATSLTPPSDASPGLAVWHMAVHVGASVGALPVTLSLAPPAGHGVAGAWAWPAVHLDVRLSVLPTWPSDTPRRDTVDAEVCMQLQLDVPAGELGVDGLSGTHSPPSMTFTFPPQMACIPQDARGHGVYEMLQAFWAQGDLMQDRMIKVDVQGVIGKGHFSFTYDRSSPWVNAEPSPSPTIMADGTWLQSVSGLIQRIDLDRFRSLSLQTLVTMRDTLHLPFLANVIPFSLQATMTLPSLHVPLMASQASVGMVEVTLPQHIHLTTSSAPPSSSSTLMILPVVLLIDDRYHLQDVAAMLGEGHAGVARCLFDMTVSDSICRNMFSVVVTDMLAFFLEKRQAMSTMPLDNDDNDANDDAETYDDVSLEMALLERDESLDFSVQFRVPDVLLSTPLRHPVNMRIPIGWQQDIQVDAVIEGHAVGTLKLPSYEVALICDAAQCGLAMAQENFSFKVSLTGGNTYASRRETFQKISRVYHDANVPCQVTFRSKEGTVEASLDIRQFDQHRQGVSQPPDSSPLVASSEVHSGPPVVLSFGPADIQLPCLLPAICPKNAMLRDLDPEYSQLPIHLDLTKRISYYLHERMPLVALLQSLVWRSPPRNVVLQFKSASTYAADLHLNGESFGALELGNFEWTHVLPFALHNANTAPLSSPAASILPIVLTVHDLTGFYGALEPTAMNRHFAAGERILRSFEQYTKDGIVYDLVPASSTICMQPFEDTAERRSSWIVAFAFEQLLPSNCVSSPTTAPHAAPVQNERPSNRTIYRSTASILEIDEELEIYNPFPVIFNATSMHVSLFSTYQPDDTIEDYRVIGFHVKPVNGTSKELMFEPGKNKFNLRVTLGQEEDADRQFARQLGTIVAGGLFSQPAAFGVQFGLDASTTLTVPVVQLQRSTFNSKYLASSDWPGPSFSIFRKVVEYDIGFRNWERFNIHIYDMTVDLDFYDRDGVIGSLGRNFLNGADAINYTPAFLRSHRKEWDMIYGSEDRRNDSIYKLGVAVRHGAPVVELPPIDASSGIPYGEIATMRLSIVTPNWARAYDEEYINDGLCYNATGQINLGIGNASQTDEFFQLELDYDIVHRDTKGIPKPQLGRVYDPCGHVGECEPMMEYKEVENVMYARDGSGENYLPLYLKDRSIGISSRKHIIIVTAKDFTIDLAGSFSSVFKLHLRRQPKLMEGLNTIKPTFELYIATRRGRTFGIHFDLGAFYDPGVETHRHPLSLRIDGQEPESENSDVTNDNPQFNSYALPVDILSGDHFDIIFSYDASMHLISLRITNIETGVTHVTKFYANIQEVLRVDDTDRHGYMSIASTTRSKYTLAMWDWKVGFSKPFLSKSKLFSAPSVQNSLTREHLFQLRDSCGHPLVATPSISAANLPYQHKLIARASTEDGDSDFDVEVKQLDQNGLFQITYQVSKKGTYKIEASILGDDTIFQQIVYHR